MFESLVANLLNRFLGSYIENFDPKQLNIGIWSGDVKLRNLRLKKESLDKFKMPIDVKFGHIGELTLLIPWSNLKGKPVKVVIEDVYLLASPIILEEFDPEEDERRTQKLKQDKLDDLEALINATNQNLQLSSDLSSNESFTESLVTKIVDNLQVTIKNIHVRYEDDSLLTESPYSVGITLNELSAVSTDQGWVPSFISITQAFTHKLLTLEKLSCYMTTDSDSDFCEDPEELLLRLKNCIHIPASDMQYLLKPVSGQGRLTVNKAGATEKSPHIKAELFFEEFGIDLDSQQYRDILWTASKFHWYIKTQKFRKFRPTVSVQEDPKEWFRYTAKSILNEIHEKNHKWTWEHFAKRRDQRKAYIKLWKLNLLNKSLSVSQQEEFDQLEIDLPFEDIKFYRSLARNQIRKENLVASANNSSDPNKQAAAAGGWLSSWWGGGAQNNAAEKTPHDDDESADLALSDDQRKALYDAIDYNENQDLSDAIDIPRDRVKMEVLATLKKGGISIRHAKNSPDMAQVVFEGCTTQIYQRPDSLLANFQLQEFRVEDGTDTTLYKHIVSVKQAHSTLHEIASTSDSSSSSLTPSAKEEPFFRISFEQNPLDGSADSVLLGKLKSMTIFYNPHFIEEVMKFFKPPKIHLDTVGAIMNAAEATMEGITSQTRIGLQYALEEHKTINVKLDLQAPLIILPLDPTSWKSPVAILDAGHISVISDLVDPKTIEEIRAKESYTESDWTRLNTLMYDRFNLHLQDAQFLVGPTIKSTMEQLHSSSGEQSALILDKLNLKLSLGISILPDATNLAKIKVGGEVPKLHLAINDFQYKTIMNIIDAAIPNLEDIDAEESSVFNAFGNNAGGLIEALDETSSSEDSSSSAVKETKSRLAESQKKQHQFEFDFNVDLVRVSLSRCIDGLTLKAEPLVDLVGDALSLNFFKTEADMHLDLYLQDINVLDYIEKSGIPEFEKLISSNSFRAQNDDQKLFKLDYLRTQRLVEFKGKEIEVFDQDIKLDIATVKFVISRKSLLSILNFILNTFTDPNAEATPADELNQNDSKDDEVSPQKIHVSVNLESIIAVLNEDGIKLATLQLSTADIYVFLVPEEMEVKGKIGALSLHDETNHGSPRDSLLRSLISIEGDHLAEFTYKTFNSHTNTSEFNSFVEFKTGSAKINFVEDAFNKIFNYLNQFLRMKAIYDRARDAAINQATQIDDANKIKFNFQVRAPTIVFPKLADPSNQSYDKVIAHLGELYASNDFVTDDAGVVKNVISSGLRNTSLASHFIFDEAEQIAEMVRDLDITFHIDYYEEYVESKPSILVNGKMAEVDMDLTELQLQHLLQISESVSTVFAAPDDSGSLDDIEEDAANANAVAMHNTTVTHELSVQDRALEQVSSSEKTNAEIPPDHKKVQLSFFIPRLSLTLYNRTGGLEKFTQKKISSFALDKFMLTFDMNEDSHFGSEVSVKSFTVSDVRQGTSNKFREIIPLISTDNNQFVLSAVTDGPSDNKNTTLMLTVENPKTILALDYIFELQAFANKVTESSTKLLEVLDEDSDDDEPTTQEPKSNTKSVAKSTSPTSPASKVGFSINVSDPSIILLADPSDTHTQAIVFKVEQVLITSQNVLSVAANKIGMFIIKMNDNSHTRLRVIDDFSVSFAHDSRGSDYSHFLTNIQLSMDLLLVRVSLRDIRLALEIVNRASELFNEAQGITASHTEDEYNFSEDFKRRLSQYAPSIISNFSKDSKSVIKQGSENQVVIKGEEFNASFGGARFVIIGDVHELPVLDVKVQPFEARAINWSTDLSAEVHFESFINIYNYARSAWEPLLEPWPITVYASKVFNPKYSLVVDVVSRKLSQITLSSHSIALLSLVFSSITTEKDLKSRDDATPYRIQNTTGFDIEVWAVKNGTKKEKKVIKSREKANFAFQNWREIRENLETDNAGDVLGVHLIGSSYDELAGIPASGEGEEVYLLYPPVEGVHHRIVCEVTLGEDNVKTIWLRSTVTVQNNDDIPIAVRIDDKNGVFKEIVIQPQASEAIPVDRAYSCRIQFRPAIEAAYEWSENGLHWQDFLGGGLALRCSASLQNDKSSFYFQAEAVYDPSEPLARIYPHMQLIISAPVLVENLLPYDLDYRLYDKSAKKDWSGCFSKGVLSHVNMVSLKSLLLLSVEPKEAGYGKSEFAIINSPHGSEFSRENTLGLRHQDGQLLKLRIHYPKRSTGRTALKVVIYSPYVVINRTGQNIVIQGNRGHQTFSAGKSHFKPITPTLFSFETFGDRKNRALVSVGDSAWSEPLSFDAIGQSSAAKAQVHGEQTEMNFGISIKEGEGKYNLSKVITITPRYVLRNTLNETLMIVENGSQKQLEVKAGDLIPLFGLRRMDKKSLLIKLAHSKTWSSPFAIDDIGQLYLKVAKAEVGQILLKVTIFTENATIFIQIENANNNWPFSIRNFSDSEFYVYQGDPNVNENGEVVKQDTVYKPVFYRVPPKSVMPYAYDYPNAVIKELLIRSHGRERAINLAEIGNLKPFRLPQTVELEEAIVDINVIADGPTQSLIISNYDPSVSLYKLQGNRSESTANVSLTNFEVAESDDYHTKIITKFEGFGISLINTRYQELCYITLRGLELRYNESDLYQNISAKLKWIQIDNQLNGGIFPIVLYPTVVPKSGKEMSNHPSLSASVCKVKDDSHGVLFIKYATILLQEMTLEIDEDFLFALLDFSKIPGASWNKDSEDKLYDGGFELPQPKKLTDSSDIYFEALHLQPIAANLSFMRTERINVEDKLSSQNALMFFFNVLTMAIGNINDSPIKLNALFIENIRVPMAVLTESIQTHYGQSFFYQVHKVLGSADFLGNPVGLFNNLSSGVLDIFYEPYQGFILNDRPQELGIGLAKGGLKFLKKSIFGFSDSFAKMTGSIAKGLSVVTLDKNFQERRRLNQRRNKPKHALYGFTAGANSFFESVSSGVTGVATAPIEGANKDGAAGFFKGLGKGVVGLPTKTAIGFFDLASNVSAGIRNTTTVFDSEGLDKVRLPRNVPHDKVIRPYSQREAQGQFWLNSIDGGVLYNEAYLAHLVLSGEENAVIVTYRMIILFEINKLNSRWQIAFDQIKNISVEPTGITIGLQRGHGPFIPIPDQKSRAFLYNRIGIAVEEFNKHCQVVL